MGSDQAVGWRAGGRSISYCACPGVTGTVHQTETATNVSEHDDRCSVNKVLLRETAGKKQLWEYSLIWEMLLKCISNR
jgi:hypothetical protein